MILYSQGRPVGNPLLLSTAPWGGSSSTRSAQRRWRLGRCCLESQCGGQNIICLIPFPDQFTTKLGQESLSPFRDFINAFCLVCDFFLSTTKIPWCLHMVANYLTTQRDGQLMHVTAGADLKDIMLSAKSHSEKVIHRIRLFIWHCWNDKMVGLEKGFVVAQGWKWWWRGGTYGYEGTAEWPICWWWWHSSVSWFWWWLYEYTHAIKW